MTTDSKPSRWLATAGRPRLGIVALLGAAMISYSFLSTDVNQVSAAAPKAPARLTASTNGVPPAAAAEYAWYLFSVAMAPSPGQANPLSFENWTEQCSFSPLMPNTCSAPTPPTGAAAATKGKKPVRKAHGSALQQKLAPPKSAAGSPVSSPAGCSTLGTGPSYPKVTVPALAGQTFCEEVFASPDEAAFINTNGLTTLTGQKNFAMGKNLSMPWTSVEIKADWISQGSLTACSSPTVYMEIIQFEGQNAACYALVGIHISSKVLPDWLWATFEPINAVTNPNRCNPNLYDTCFDPWGTNSAVPYGPGNPAAQSPALAAAMKGAGLPAVFNNYFLTGAQTQFVDANNKPIPLGNSFVEYWAGVKPGEASCITCHSYAIMNPTTTPPTGAAQGFPPSGKGTGLGATVQAGNIQQDFSWMLGFMAPAAPTAAAKKK
ncbi:MAG: hypothetical protein HY255_11250 [Betaproteobacteria bacterium]|nr:hypothetical protein [Betaproteobacteria bacterium]